MRGLMMDRPLLISGLIQYAAEYHGDTEIVTRTVEGPIHRYNYAESEARVQRVQHRPDAGDAVIKLEMAVRVPGEGGDAIAELDTQPRQRVGNLLRPRLRLGVIIAMNRPLDGACHDLGLS